MDLPSWPAGVPTDVQAGSWEIAQWAQPSLQTEMNSGTMRRRRKYTVRISLVKCTIVMTHAQLDAFKAFHADLGDGAGRFAMPVYDGSRYVPRTCCFGEGPAFGTAERFGKRDVTMTLRVENL